MKKGLILSFEFPPHPGGIGTYAYQIALNFHRMGIPVVALVTPNTETDEENAVFDKAQEFMIYRFKRQKLYPLKVLGRLVELVRFCRRHQIEWIYACSLRAAYIAWICKFVLNIPYFWVGYGTELTDFSRSKRFLINQALGLFAISKYAASLIQNYTDRSITVIPLGADVKYYDPDLVTDQDIECLVQKYAISGDPVLLSVGSLKPRKGHDITLKALPTIKAKYPDVQLLIVGMTNVAGAEVFQSEIYKFVRENSLETNVKFVPNVSAEELRTFYKLADVFILSSRNAQGDVEGFGIVLVEANAMGTPVVASASGGIVDAVEDGKSGFLYQEENPNDLADKILQLLKNDTLRKEMGSYGRKRAFNEFNWQVVADRTWEALSDMELSLD